MGILIFALVAIVIAAVVCLGIWARRNPRQYDSLDEFDEEVEWRNAIK